MKLTTSKGKEYLADYALPLPGDGSLLIQLHDEKTRVSVIAAEFEGLEWIETNGHTWDEYTDLRLAYRLNEDTVQLRLYE